MKKLLCLLLSVLLSFGLTACGGTQTADGLEIVCSTFPQYDFLREITRGTDVSLRLLLRPGQESHDYDPSSQDIAALHRCDLFVYVGGESDAWIDKTMQSVDVTDKTVLKLMDMVPPICAEHHHEEHNHSHTEETYDEHVWTSPHNAAVIATRLTETVCELDTANADTYRKNADAFIEALDALDAAFQQTVDAAARREIVVADRFPLLYFTHRYGLSHHAAFAGCAASVEPASADVQALIDTVNEHRIPVVFRMELSAGTVAEAVAEQTGCEVRTFYACHNLSKTDFDNGETYLSLMQKNLTVLKEALY